MNRRLRGRLRRRKLARDGGTVQAATAQHVQPDPQATDESAHIEWDSSRTRAITVLSSQDGNDGEPYSFPLGVVIAGLQDKVDDLDDRVFDIERGEVDPGELMAERASVDPSELMPLHQMYTTATNLEPDQHDLTNNQEIAARLFPYLPAKADLREGSFYLRTPKLKQAIERELGTDDELAGRLDVDQPNPNTARRAMEFIAKFSDGMIEFVTDDGKTNYLTWSRDGWLQYEADVEEAAFGGDDGGR